MSAVTKDQYTAQLAKWMEDIKRKQRTLENGYRVYKVIHFAQIAISSICTAISLFLNSLIIGMSEADGGNRIAITTISAVAAFFSMIVLFWNAVGIVFNPSVTASSASQAAKAYMGLYQELDVEVQAANMEIGDICEEKYKASLLYYSTREQLILYGEPGMIFVGYWHSESVFDGSKSVMLLSGDELEYISEFIRKHPEVAEDGRIEEILVKVIGKYSSPNLI